MGMKIAEGSIYEFEINTYGSNVVELSNMHEEIIRIHIDDIPALIKELERISKSEN